MMKKLKDFDFILMITPILLSAFGIVMIYSASMVMAVVEGFEPTHYLYRQLLWFLIGLAGFIACSIFPYQNYQKLMKFIVLTMVFLLVGVLFFGEVRGNARSWFVFGPISFQPSEITKLGLVMYLASVYSKKQEYIHDFYKGVLPPLVLTGIILSLIMMEPDIGTTAIIFLIASTVVISSGIRRKHLLVLAFVTLLLIAFTIPKMVTDVRISRFTGAYQPFEAPDDSGYHLIQSYLAIGGGGVTGEGLGQSVQKLGYLFGAHTDFIMSVISEELGFFGVALVIGMLSLIVLRGLFIARKCEDSFGSLLAIGISSMIGIQSFINIGAISGILPITGVTLPFVSYGGSSLFVTLIAMGVLNNIAMTAKKNDGQAPMRTDVPESPNIQRFNQRGGKRWSS
ncbi:MAG TPA: putative lipid II flippase FtsW [Bacillota bacterium]|nr:putative lipid II flippase FtsW [Bacillota bacterium]